MHRLQIAGWTLSVLTSLSHAAPPVQTAPAATEANDLYMKGFALVELFTSEGCSSCPPADEAVADLIRDTGKMGRNLFVLAYHVDYWDSLGWKDPYASRACSERQHEYVTAFKIRSAYTPQAIVNGAEEFVGSDRSRLARSVAAAEANAQTVALSGSHGNFKPGTPVHVTFSATIPETLAGSDKFCVIAALVENELSSKVVRGENSGRTLTHERVVRAFASKPLGTAPGPKAEGDIELNVPKGFVPEHGSVVVFVQRTDTMAVLGAANAERIAAKDR